jgi:hypothetical protein
MTDPRDKQERIARLEAMARAQPLPVRHRIKEAPDAEPMRGQLWHAQVASHVDPEEDPSPLVLILECREIGPIRYFNVLPVFHEVEMLGPYDILLPEELFGHPLAVMIDSDVAIDRQNLASCVGRLPDVWIERVEDATTHERDTRDPEIIWGLPYLGSDDPRPAFHEEMIERTLPMQGSAFTRYQEKISNAGTQEGLPSKEKVIPFPVRRRLGELLQMAAGEDGQPAVALARIDRPWDEWIAGDNPRPEDLVPAGHVRDFAPGQWDLADATGDEDLNGGFVLLQLDEGLEIARGEVDESIATVTRGDPAATGPMILIFWTLPS